MVFDNDIKPILLVISLLTSPFGGKINEPFCLENTSNLTNEFVCQF